jgi:cytochrome d ubiquinol oxidase subunit II
MPREEIVALMALLGTVLYGVLAGADFGGGVWDLLARGPRKRAQRETIAHAMGPVWEANHVWLIFVIVVLFTCFPRAHAALSVGLFLPFHLALIGIVLRGAAFVFRSYGPKSGPLRARWGAVFGASSVITPVLLGMCMGAVSSGAMRASDTVIVTGGAGAWLSPVALAMGAFALALCAYVAAVFLTHESEGALREDFRARALGAGTVVVALSALLVPFVRAQAPHLWLGFGAWRAVPLLAAGTVAALASGFALYTRRFALARAATVVQVGCVLGGWGAAQYPFIVYPDFTLTNSAAPAATLNFVLVAVPIGGLVLVPSLWFLFRVFKGAGAKTGEHG